MQRVQIDWLDAGALPLYDTGGTEDYYVLAEDQTTWNVHRMSSRRVLLPINLDAPLAVLEQRLPELLAPFQGQDGTFILSVRTCADIPIDQSILYDQTSASTTLALPTFGGRFTTTTSTTSSVPEVTYRLVLAALGFVPDALLGVRAENPAEVLLAALRAGWPTAPDLDAPVLSDEEHEAIRASHDRYFAQISERQKKKEACTARAREILLEFLDPEQRAEFEAEKRFRVQGQDGHAYLIEYKAAHNVFRLEGETKVVEYCLVASGYVPIPDLMLTQKILLESDPAPFFAKANVWRIEDGKRGWVERPPRPYLDPATMELVHPIPDLIGDLAPLDVVHGRPDLVPAVNDGGCEAEGNTGMPLGVGIHVAGEGSMTGEPAIGAATAELVPNLGSAGDGLGVAAVGAEVDASGFNVGAAEAAPLAEEDVRLRMVG